MSFNRCIEGKRGAYDKGVQAEKLAARFLERQGFEVIEMRYKTSFGEVDIVAYDPNEDMLAFVEVKARSDYREGVEAISFRSRRRIEKAALSFISDHEAYLDSSMRFDAVIISERKGDILIDHLDNAWMSGQ